MVFMVVSGRCGTYSCYYMAVRCQRGSVSVGILVRSLIGSGGSTVLVIGSFGFHRQIGTELIGLCGSSTVPVTGHLIGILARGLSIRVAVRCKRRVGIAGISA